MSVRYNGKKIASNDSELPAQTGNSGKFLTTNGTRTSWKTLTPSDASALPDTTKYGATITVSLNTTDYKMTTTLKDQDGNTLGTAQVIDFPIESVVVSGAYDNVNKKIVLTLQNGSTIDIPVGDLINGLQSEITVSNKLDADLVDDTNSVHKFVNKLSELTGDVSISSPVNGNHLVYNGITGKWENTASAATINWGDINGILNDQTDLKDALDAKANSADLAKVATTGDYDDIINKPTIPAAQVNSDWNANSGVAEILNKPTLGTAAAADTTDFATAAQGGKADTALQNTATGTNSLTILGDATSANTALNIGPYSTAEGTNSLAIGPGTGSSHRARATHANAIALGYDALALAIDAIQIGTGQATIQGEFKVWNYRMLEKSTGLIPDARISTNIARSADVYSMSYDSENQRLVIAKP